MTADEMELRQLESSGTFGPKGLVQLLWDFSSSNKRLFNGDSISQLCHSAYCEYYERQWGLTAAHCDGKFVALKTPEAVNQLVQELQSNRSRAELLALIQDASEENALGEACENSLNLAFRLLLMLRIGVVKYQFLPRRCLDWNEGSPRDFVKKHFGEEPVLDFDDVKLPKAFNGWSLKKIGGIEINFTDNLADHLLLVEDDSKVLIFHYASFLDCQRLKGWVSTSKRDALYTKISRSEESLFPPGFAEETLRTLALLFPQSLVNGSDNSRTSRKSWFRKLCDKRKTCKIDERLGRCGTLHAEDRQIKGFIFWRDRLIILKQAYDEATPRTLSQFWYDRRNGVQWYTFWVAILVLIITTILSVLQCVEGGFQAWKI
ncbi:hypothetical protein NM208_g4329 [Fusarium decemcellulare]|uniref:Uncharacterized protein n=1 Tax=Fusarium decemcellulare TaxID=57161 RepID=A0ACC1SL52_9HYPO|nr:hypothetical protein NM208_g4329 [Fusarium decemcellulare]